MHPYNPKAYSQLLAAYRLSQSQLEKWRALAALLFAGLLAVVLLSLYTLGHAEQVIAAMEEACLSTPAK